MIAVIELGGNQFTVKVWDVIDVKKLALNVSDISSIEALLISDAEWYDGGFRAQTVAYTISYLSYIVKKTDKYLNFYKIRNFQNFCMFLLYL